MAADKQIDLAAVTPFALGALTIEPATLRVIAGETETLEPRVMQVLVALKQAGGQTVSRDHLIERCWSGRVVGDDAINRAIGRLRKLSATHEGAGFQIETVPRVGYRLIETRPVEAKIASGLQAGANRRWWQRAMIVGIAAGFAIVALIAFPKDRGVAAAVQVAPITGIQPLADTMRRNLLAADASDVRFVTDDTPPYRLAVSITRDDGGTAAFVTLADPEGTLWQSRMPIDSAHAGAVAGRLADTLKCIVSAATSRSPERAAFVAYANYCAENTQPSYDDTRQLAFLRRAAADPEFVAAQQDLALFMGFAALSHPEPAASMYRAEGLAAARRAQLDSPDDALSSYGLFLLQTRANFRGRAKIVARVAKGNQGQNGSGFQLQGHFMASVGRTSEALAAYQKRLAVLPESPIDGMLVPTMLARQGRYGDAKALYAKQEQQFGLHQRLARAWLIAALATGDADTVARIAPVGAADERVRAVVMALAAAKARHDSASVAREGDRLVALMAAPGAVNSVMAMALAVAGRDREAIRAVELLFDGPDAAHATNLLYWPVFARARQLPEFAAATARMGLSDYWLHTDAQPDFCAEPFAPALCAALSEKKGSKRFSS